MFEALLGRYIQIRERAEVETIDCSNFSSAYLSFGSSERSELFDSVRSVWSFAYDWEILRSLVECVTQADLGYLQAIKLVRKQGVLLSSAYEYFDQRHSVPKKHGKLMKKLGKLNDSASELEYQEWRTNAMESIDNYGSTRRLDYEPESNSRYLAYTLARTRELKQTFSSDTLPRKQFHEARQNFRGLMNLMEMRAVFQDTEEAYLEFRNWLVLSRQLGEMTDTQESLGIEGSETTSRSQITIDPMLRALVLRQLSQNN